MKYKFFVFAPRDDEIINSVISAASNAGAGNLGNYTNVAFIQEGQGNWKSEKGSDPHVGMVGEMSREDEVLIQMECSSNDAKSVQEAIKKVHPYEEVVVDFIKLEEV